MSSRPIIVLGGQGQLGRALIEQASTRRTPLVCLSKTEADVTDLAGMRRFARELDPAAIINAAAFTDVDGAESRPETAYAVNVQGAENAAVLARSLGVPLLHLSTDYVFDGSKGAPYVEDDAPNPLGVYGDTKLSGEGRVLEVGGDALICRTSCLYGNNGSNFVRSILKAAAAGRSLQVVDDQVGSPTLDLDLAAALLDILASRTGATPFPAHRILHLGGSDSVSRFDWACAAVALAERWIGTAVQIERVATICGSGQSARPGNSTLSGELAKDYFGIWIPGWRAGLARMVQRHFTSLNYNEEAA